MNVLRFNRMVVMFAIVAVGLAAGCAQQASSPTEDATAVAETSNGADDHSGWWCGEHGIPEEQCSMCSVKAAEACKEKGDWCEEHDRADSQCFVCHPDKAEKFAKLYEAKFGEAPPKPTE